MHAGARLPHPSGHVSERKKSNVVPFSKIYGAGLSMLDVQDPGGNDTSTDVLLRHGVHGPSSDGAV